jgi:hypothetical protein
MNRKDADFLVSIHGSVWTIEALSDGARAFADETFEVPGWAGVPTHFTTDWRPARDLCERLEADGFNLWSA